MKRVMQFAVYAAWHQRLENAYTADTLALALFASGLDGAVLTLCSSLYLQVLLISGAYTGSDMLVQQVPGCFAPSVRKQYVQ